MAASAEKTIIMNVAKDKIQQVLTDYESYPKFMDGVSNVSIVSKDGNTTKAQYDLNIIKTFSYVLALTENDNGLSWTFDCGDIFSLNNGSWELKDQGDGTTEVTYKIEVDIKIKMIGSGMIIKKLVNTSLPSMLKEVEKRAQSL